MNLQQYINFIQKSVGKISGIANDWKKSLNKLKRQHDIKIININLRIKEFTIVI